MDYDKKLAASTVFNTEQKKELHGILSARVDVLDQKKGK
jgi:hypothetical protein